MSHGYISIIVSPSDHGAVRVVASARANDLAPERELVAYTVSCADADAAFQAIRLELNRLGGGDPSDPSRYRIPLALATNVVRRECERWSATV